MTSKWYVKLARGSWETVISSYIREDWAKNRAAALNEEYQTDEYYVEAHDPEKEWKLN